LRLLLAMSVVYGHVGLMSVFGVPSIPGDTAVQAFYAISGFYMALVLNETYSAKGSTYLLFLTNRFLRLFPAYAVVALLTLGLALVVHSRSGELPFVLYWQAMPALPVAELAPLLASQITIIGMDIHQLLTLQTGSLSLVTDFDNDTARLQGLLLNPPAWTLGLEFSFYLIAPLVARRPVPVIAAILFGSITLRLLLQFGFGLHNLPWSYMFFPSELALFMAGVLGYRIYRARENGAVDSPLWWLFVAACASIAVAVLINRLHGWSRVASTGLLFCILLAIPALFRATRTHRIDRFLGELSYPIYIGHMLVMWTCEYLLLMPIGAVYGLTVLATTFIVALGLYWCVDRPIDAWRHRRLPLTRLASLGTLSPQERGEGRGRDRRSNSAARARPSARD
jgi:peptidoglycan/LPS O-acetylase OafA/YrhL